MPDKALREVVISMMFFNKTFSKLTSKKPPAVLRRLDGFFLIKKLTRKP
jgi:hypothetical protein